MMKFIVISAFVCLSGPAGAQDQKKPQKAHHGKSADQVAKELVNPNSSFASLTFKKQFRWYTDNLPNADDQNNYTLLFPPVFPFTLKPTAGVSKANLFVRPDAWNDVDLQSTHLMKGQPLFGAFQTLPALP